MGENSWNGYEQNCLFTNVGDDLFVDTARPAGADGLGDGRGVAVADLDGDGRLDLAINNNNAVPTIYFNRSTPQNNWLMVEVIGDGHSSSRDAVGARVALTLAGGRTMTRWVEAGSGYAAQSAFPVHFGLGTAIELRALEVTWPSGSTRRLEGAELEALGLNRTLRLEEGSPQIVHRPPEESSSSGS